MNEFTRSLKEQTNPPETLPVIEPNTKSEVDKEIGTVSLRELTSRKLKLPIILNKLKTMNYNDKPDPTDIAFVMKVLLQKVIMSEADSNRYRVKAEFRNSGTHQNALEGDENSLKGEQIPDILKDHMVIAEYFIKGSEQSNDEYVGGISIEGPAFYQILNSLDKITKYQEFQKKSITNKKINDATGKPAEEKNKPNPPDDINYKSISLRSGELESDFTDALKRKKAISEKAISKQNQSQVK